MRRNIKPHQPMSKIGVFGNHFSGFFKILLCCIAFSKSDDLSFSLGYHLIRKNIMLFCQYPLTKLKTQHIIIRASGCIT